MTLYNYRISLERIIIFLFFLLLPTQLGKHFFPDFAFINGVKIDYLAIALYTTDLLAIFLFLLHHRSFTAHVRAFKYKFLTVGFFLLINVLQSREPIVALYYILKAIEAYFIFFLFRFRKTSVRSITIPLLIGTSIQLLLASLQFVQMRSIQGIFYFFGERLLSVSSPGVAKTAFMSEEILRPYGTFSHPNSMAGFYVLIYAFCLFLQTRKGSFHNFGEKVVIYVLLGLSSALIFISFSKAAIATYLLITCIFFLRFQMKSSERCLPCDISKLAIPITIAFVFLQGQNGPESIETRLFLLGQSVSIMIDTYFLGTGFGQFLYYQAAYASPYVHFFLQPVHNIFVLFLVQAGLFFSLFAGHFVLRFILKYSKRLGLIFLSILITGIFDHYWLTLQQNILAASAILGLSAYLVDSSGESEVRSSS